MLYTSKRDKLSSLDIAVPLSCIEKITLSPWMHPSFSSFVKDTLRAMSGCKGLDIVRCALIGNAEWMNLGEDVK